MAPLTYLVASPHLSGGMFERAVILLFEHTAEGAMGLIINLQTDMAIGDLLPQARGRSERAWMGGPVEPQVGWCLFSRATGVPGEIRLAQNLHVTSSLEVLEAVLAREGQFMLMLGYAGWGAGQLDHELKEGTWLWVEAGPELALEVPPGERWQRALDLLGVDPARVMPGGAEA